MVASARRNLNEFGDHERPDQRYGFDILHRHSGPATST